MENTDKGFTINRLQTIPYTDPEIAHAEADALVVAYLRAIGETEVADAWQRAGERIGFWCA